MFKIMKMTIKIALPTNDRINISENITGSEFFKIISVDNGKIVEEKFLQSKFSEILKNKPVECVAKICDMIADCNYILTHSCSEEIKNYFKERKKIIVPTSEKIITNVVVDFIKELTTEESDTCCSP